MTQFPSADRDLDLEAGQIDPSNVTSTGALQDIAFKSGTKVKHLLNPSLQFVVQILISLDDCSITCRWSSSKL